MTWEHLSDIKYGLTSLELAMMGVSVPCAKPCVWLIWLIETVALFVALTTSEALRAVWWVRTAEMTQFWCR